MSCKRIYMYFFNKTTEHVGNGSRIHALGINTRTKSAIYNRPRRPRGGIEVWLYSFSNLCARWWVGGRHHASAALPPVKEIRYPLYRRLGGAPGPVWAAAENLASTGIRSTDSPARSESLYRLSYAGPH